MKLAILDDAGKELDSVILHDATPQLYDERLTETRAVNRVVHQARQVLAERAEPDGEKSG